MFQSCRNHVTEKLIQGRNVPVAVHVGLAQTQRSSCGTSEEAVLQYLDVPWPVAVNRDTCPGQRVCHNAFEYHGSRTSAAGRIFSRP